MKKILIGSLIISSLLIGNNKLPNFPIEKKFLSNENGGEKTAIDAYSDGVGIYTVSKFGIDNSAMNELVFIYGEEAKKDGESLKKYINEQGTEQEKLLANELGNLIEKPTFIVGEVCDDKNENTKNDKYINENGDCVGEEIIRNSCKEIKENNENSKSGYYKIKFGTKEENLYCDMETEGGGWTQVYNYFEQRNAGKSTGYYIGATVDILEILNNSSETIIGFANENHSELKYAVKFNLPADWKTGFPASHTKYSNKIIQINYKILTPGYESEVKNQYLAYGLKDYNYNCNSPFLNTGLYGKICVSGNSDKIPFYQGIVSSNGPYFNQGKMTEENSFIIYVR
jgi:hypothetical protein